MKSLLLTRFNLKLLVLFLFLTGILTVFGAGEVDTSFNASITTNSGGEVTKILIQPDGKILIGGFFRTVNGVARSGLARLNTDGTLDSSFALLDFRNSLQAGGTIWDLALQSNGKILVGGDFVEINGVPKYRLVRLNTDGTIDETFAGQPITNTVLDIAVLPDDRILIGGSFQYVAQNGTRDKIARLNVDGTLDTSVTYASQNNFINGIVPQADGKIVVSNIISVFRYNADGSFDNTFGPLSVNNQVFRIEPQADGNILVGGSFSNVNGFGVGRLMRITPNGMVDGTFNNSGPDGNVRGIFIAPNGKIVIGGGFLNYNGTGRKRVAVLTSNGTLDTSYNYTNHNFSQVNDVAMQADGKVLVAGMLTSSNNALTRTNTDGLVDSGFNAAVRVNGTAQKVFVQPDGKVLVGGAFLWADETGRTNLARFNADGTLDTSFVPPSFDPNFLLSGIDVQPDGKILVSLLGAATAGYNAVRLNSNGSVDVNFSFGLAGSRDIKVLSNGKILVAFGTSLKLLNSNGTTDGTFNTSVIGEIYKILPQPDGKILICGAFSSVNGTTRAKIARVNADGTLDTSFNPGGGANDTILDMALQPDGKIVIGGAFTGFNFDLNKKYLARLNADGSLDTNFTPTLDAQVSTLKIQTDGKILFGGAMTLVNGAARRGIGRLNADSTLDTSFNPGRGTNSSVLTLDLQTDGKILYGGTFSTTNGFSTPGIGRLLNTTAPPRKLFDYDGDGRSDVSVFRASENKWYILQSSNAQTVQTVFAIPGDVPAPADFDGDGKTDVAIFRPSSGDWWYLSSINNAQVNVHWGQAGDIPRPSDFDGDGKADYVVYRPSNGVWYRYGSTGATSILAFGIAEDKPLIGDFDGDGKSDVAIFRPSTGDWWFASSINGQFVSVHWGANGDIPVPADYDGDGKTDFAVYRPSNGGWYIQNSSNGSFNIQAFGLAEDKPVAADYDGDGKADIAVFRPSTGTWYLLQTTAGFGALQFGISTDVPTENAFIQ